MRTRKLLKTKLCNFTLRLAGTTKSTILQAPLMFWLIIITIIIPPVKDRRRKLMEKISNNNNNNNNNSDSLGNVQEIYI